MKKEKVATLLRLGGAASLILFPVFLMIAFALHFESIADFFDFKLKYIQNSATDFMETLSGPDKDRLFLIPHYIGYIAVLFMLATALVLGKLLYKQRPLHSVIGTGMSLFGVIFLSGVFAVWLSFAAVGNVDTAMTEIARVVLVELTTMQGPLLYITILSSFSLAGLLVLGFGLFKSNITYKWSAASFMLGNLLIIIFMDLDNWMFIGAFLMLLGLLPVSIKLFHNKLALA